MDWRGIPDEYRNQIVTGDARLLAERIPDESIDLIFTDPVYDQLDDYEWLGKIAERVLKDEGLCITYIDDLLTKFIMKRMDYSLVYRGRLNELKIAAASLDGRTYMRHTTTALLAYSKGTHDNSFWLTDLVHSRFNGEHNNNHSERVTNHVWTKNTYAIQSWLNMLPFRICFDPFTGGGTVPAICKMLGRNYVAFEIIPETAELARERVQNTQPPLFVLQPEQAEMGL